MLAIFVIVFVYWEESSGNVEEIYFLKNNVIRTRVFRVRDMAFIRFYRIRSRDS